MLIEFTNEREVAEARDRAADMASGLGFGRLDCAQVALAVSEIAGNAHKFAGRGTVALELTANKKGLEIIVRDRGQGINSIKKVMVQGYSSESLSLGVGLNAAQRAVDELSIRSKVGQGTTVVMRNFLPIPEEEIEYGVISMPDERYPVNGDAYVIKEFRGDRVLLAVIDGTGNGFKANKVADFVKNTVEGNYRSGLTAIVKRCHSNLRKKFDISSYMSCVMGLLLLKPRSLEYAGIGDISIQVLGSPRKIHLLSQRGIVGDIRLPDLKLQKHRCGRNIIIVICSDGISPRFTDKDLPLDQSAQNIADFIMENYRRQYGDATVLVVKRKG